MICAGRTLSPARLPLRGALEPLFGAGPADDLFSLTEAEPGLLQAEDLPELLEARLELFDLDLDRRVEPPREPVPELLAVFGEPLDLEMNLVRCHVG